MTRYHIDTNVTTGEETVAAYSLEEEAAADAMLAESSSAERNPLSATQLRLGLVRNGISLQTVIDAINAISDQQVRDEAWIHWEFATVIHWDHPQTQSLMALIGVTEESARAMWAQAITY